MASAYALVGTETVATAVDARGQACGSILCADEMPRFDSTRAQAVCDFEQVLSKL